MKKITIILAHADYKKSIANKTIIECLNKKYPHVRVRNLAKLYPEYKIDIDSEQQNLVDSDLIILQFPIYWYNMPAILKQWFDTVLTYGFAYGENGDQLKDKTVIVSATAGGSEESYTPIGHMHFHLRPLLNNIESTVYYCQMNFANPILGYDNIYIPDIVGEPDEVKKRATEQAERLIKTIDELSK